MWKNIDINENLVKARTDRSVLIAMPHKSDYDGYKFWHPSKLVRDGRMHVLYITYGCGSFGLNLQFCKHIIFAEHTWDYAVREQAEARIYRMGQGNEVNYYDMICDGVGLEDLIFKCISRKGNMLDTVKREIQRLKSAKKFVETL